MNKMKTILVIGFSIFLISAVLALDLPTMPKDMKGFHYASDTNVTVEVSKAIQAAVEILKKDGEKNLDGTNGQGMIYHVTKKQTDYWVMCQSYSISKERTLVPVVGGYVWVILDKDFKFKEMKQGA